MGSSDHRYSTIESPSVSLHPPSVSNNHHHHPHDSPPYIDGNRTWKRMTFLTISSFGTQFLWSAEMSQASPYLLSLGISKSYLSLVLMAGPLSGFFTQPIVGLYGDQNTHPLGRRRPFIIYGGLAAMISLFAFAWCRELAQLVFSSGTQGHKYLSAWLAVIAFYVLDISINVVTVSNKCLVIDVLPSVEQHLANAYASRFSGFSSILTMLISLIDLPKLFNTTTSQMKMISYFGAPIFVITHLVMCLKVHEKQYLPGHSISPTHNNNNHSINLLSWLNSTIKKFWDTWQSLDGTIVKSLCWIQLWAWIGWFPVLFYSTTWIGETWSIVNQSDDHEKATRTGSIGLLIEAILSLLGWMIIPILVSNFRLKHYGSKSDAGKTLVNLWCYSQVFFGLLLLISPVCEGSVNLSIILIGACGISWAITTWAPATLLGEAILQKPQLMYSLNQDQESFRLLPLEDGHHRHSPKTNLMQDDRVEPLNVPPHSLMTNQLTQVLEEPNSSSNLFTNDPSNNRPNGDKHPGITEDGLDKVEDEDEQGLLEELELDHLRISKRDVEENQLAGTILGINNLFVVVPQFIITFISFVLFKSLELQSGSPPQSKTSSPSTRTQISEIGLVFRVGGIASLISALFCWKLIKFININLSKPSIN